MAWKSGHIPQGDEKSLGLGRDEDLMPDNIE